jgi:ABC-type glycerol-3-phosphate transport system substrate-binding protein
LPKYVGLYPCLDIENLKANLKRRFYQIDFKKGMVIKMRKGVFYLLTFILVVSLVATFSLVGCKEEAAEEVEEVAEEAEEEAEEVAEEVEEEVVEEEREPVTLELWTPLTDDSAHFLIFQKAADIVKEKYNINVNLVSKGVSGYRELGTASAMAQSGPDLMGHYFGLADIVTAGRQGLFLPLNDLLTQDEIDSLLLMEGSTDPESGDIFGVPYNNNYLGMAYNKILFEQAGIDYNSFPAKWTYDEFIEVCEKLKSAGITPWAFTNKEGLFAHWWHSFFIPSYVDKIEDTIPLYQEKPICNEIFIDFSENWKDFYQKGYYKEGGATIGIAEVWGQFSSGDVAMGLSAGSITGIYLDGLGEENVGLIEWPSMGNGELSKANPVAGDGIGITNWTNHPDEALLFLKTLIFDKEIVAEFASGGSPPVSKKFNVADFDIGSPEVKRYLDSREKMPTFYEGHGFWTIEYSTVIEKFCNLMLQGEITIEDYCAEIEAVLE